MESRRESINDMGIQFNMEEERKRKRKEMKTHVLV